MTPLRRTAAALLTAAALGLAACGEDEETLEIPDGSGAAAQGTATTPQATETKTVPRDSGKRASVSNAQDLDSKPKISVPSKDGPPTTLVKKDLVKGKGRPVKNGDRIAVQYVGVAWSTGEEFDSSWSREQQPFELELGAGMVIPGWDQGIVGMREGGRRLLTIPPDLAYGAQGQPPTIGPDETLVFVVDLDKKQ